MHGFILRARFDVTQLVKIGGGNSLAVLDYVPTFSKKENFSSPAFICSRGWDWMPRVPGLEMGIYKDVYLSATGDLSLKDPWIRTVNASKDGADLSVETEVQNDGSADVTGELAGDIEPGHITFSQPVTIKAGQTQTVSLTAETVAALHVEHPALWWPNGYGQPNLYTMRLTIRAANAVSDQKNVPFGIRKFSYTTDNQTLRFYINGVRVFPKGGSWGMAEYLLRCNAKDYETMVRFHREMNFNIIRNWMGMTPDEAFYGMCDKYGMMVWDEFWLNSMGGPPRDTAVFEANAVDKIKQFRNHACVCLWCGDNEGAPPKPLNDFLADSVKTYDGDDRRYQPCSNRGNLSGSGPWSDFDPVNYFTGARLERIKGMPFGMRSELGTAVFTSFDSFKKFMPQSTWWPQNDMWNKHFFGGSAAHAGPRDYNGDINKRYGKAQGIEDFCRKAQMLNLETTKAMFEGFLDHSDKDAAGLIIWMSQSAYPSLVWQTFDYYYDTTGAYWGAKTSCEPVHIYWNESDDRIRVVNTTGKPVRGLTAEAAIYNLDGSRKLDQTAKVDSSPDAVSDCLTLTYPADLSATHFIKLRLTNAAGQLVSENFYWRGTTHLDYTALSNLKPVKLSIVSKTAAATTPGMVAMAADITNPTDSGTVAFALRPKLVKAGTGDQVLPVYMNDGYFGLVPGETKHITFEFNPTDAGSAAPQLVVECWNNFKATLPPAPGR
jgi:hypothetical protein